MNRWRSSLLRRFRRGTIPRSIFASVLARSSSGPLVQLQVFTGENLHSGSIHVLLNLAVQYKFTKKVCLEPGFIDLSGSADNWQPFGTLCIAPLGEEQSLIKTINTGEEWREYVSGGSPLKRWHDTCSRTP